MTLFDTTVLTPLFYPSIGHPDTTVPNPYPILEAFDDFDRFSLFLVTKMALSQSVRFVGDIFVIFDEKSGHFEHFAILGPRLYPKEAW